MCSIEGTADDDAHPIERSLDLIDLGYGKDLLLGTDISSTNGFTVTKTIPKTLALGDYTVFARAREEGTGQEDHEGASDRHVLPGDRRLAGDLKGSAECL